MQNIYPTFLFTCVIEKNCMNNNVSLQWNEMIHKLAEHSRTFVSVVFMDSLASLADLVPLRSCRSAWFTMHYNLCRSTNPSRHANPSTGVRCSCSSVCGRGAGGRTQFWFNSALKRWLRGAVIDMWASSVRQQLWLVEPAVNHPPPIVPLPVASGLRRTSLSLVCTVTSHRVCASESEGCFHGYDLISFIIKITLLYS